MGKQYQASLRQGLGMEYWEFLLQQEGDRHWLPLDTAQMEILEGRYRIMAHTSQANTPVQVQISQRLLDHNPPKRRSFKRQGTTNGEGLMVVMPFTRLQAGTWDIRCSGISEDRPEAPTADAATWAYRVQLQVLPPGVGDDEVWTLPLDTPLVYEPMGETAPDPAFADPAQGEDSPAEPDPTDIPLAEPDPTEADRPMPSVATVSLVEPTPINLAPTDPLTLDLEPIAAALEDTRTPFTTGEGGEGPQYRLHLPQTALLGQEGEAVAIMGQITGLQAEDLGLGLVLVVRLMDPQTATAVALTPFPVTALTHSTDIHLTLTVPQGLATRLLLGEVALLRSMPPISVLARQRFTLTVDLAALFDTIANQAETETDYILDFAGGRGAGQTLTGDTTEDREPNRPFDVPLDPPRSIPSFSLPPGTSSLPPKIYEPSPHEIGARQPTLPPFGLSRRRSPEVTLTPDGDPSANLGLTRPEPAEDRSAEEPETLPEPTVPGSTSATSRPSLSLPPLTPDPPVAEPPPPEPTQPLLLPHEVVGFRDLNLQTRFWSRLNDMAVSLHQEALERRQSQRGGRRRSDPQSAGETPMEWEAFVGEVVIYEDEDDTLGGSQTASEGMTRPTHPEADPIVPPVPELEVPSGDLVAGESLLVTLRVPFHPNRLYLKVWITDPQSRSLVDEPRQIMHLRPNGQGQLEGSVQVTVPLGCLEADFEAIAVDMMTQQESYKTTVSRAIVPAEWRSPDLDVFDF